MSASRASYRVAERAVLGCLCGLFAAMTAVAYGYSLQDELGPGPGFFPFWLGLIGTLVSLGLLARSWRSRSVGEGSAALWPDRPGALRALALLGGLVLSAGLLSPAGFRLTALVFTAALLVVLGARRPLAIAAFALASSIGLFHVFYHWLKVPLPVGPFGF